MDGEHQNTLYYGDNLKVLDQYIADESVDLIYLDPPFNSNASYNMLFMSPDGSDSDAQISAFDDTWSWGTSAEEAVAWVRDSGHHKTYDLLETMRAFLGENDMMAYLAMMAARLIELHRVLKPTGSLYLHCDQTASHYLKLLLDGVFGFANYRNEIIWQRTSAHGDARVSFGDVTDSVFYYSKTDRPLWNRQFSPLSDEHIEAKYSNSDDDGRRYTTRDLRSPSPRPNLTYDYNGYKPHPNGWSISRELMEEYDQKGLIYYPKKKDGRLRLKIYLDERQGRPLQNLWTDISPINSRAQERLGYPTQKPLALLERIIAASSNEGDVVLDPFCGCGTALDAAEKLGRKWIGIDVTHLAINLIEQRMRDAHPDASFKVVGRPESLAGAEELARRDKHEFEKWIVPKLEGHLFEGGRKGADGGIDGFVYFRPDAKKTEKAILSVKGGDNVGVGMIRDLHSTMEREKALAGVFITKALPTKPMVTEAAKVGLFDGPSGQKLPRLQILTLAEIFAGKRPDLPHIDSPYKKAQRSKKASGQGKLL